MKKILLSIFVVSLAAVFAGCWGGSSRVASLTFTGNDGDIAAQYYSETTMEILPNYKERTLSVRYTSVHPKKSEVSAEELAQDPGEEDVNATGSVGGEYFDRFEEVVEFVREYEVTKGDQKEVPDGLVVFSIKMEDLKANVKEVSTYWEMNEDKPEFEVATGLYLDLAKVLTEEEQV